MKNIDILNMLNGLNGVENKTLSPEVSFAVCRNISKLSEPYKAYEKEVNRLRDGYADKTDAEKTEADAQLRTLLEMDNPEIILTTVSEDAVKNCPNLTVKEMRTIIDFMMEEAKADEQ